MSITIDKYRNDRSTHMQELEAPGGFPSVGFLVVLQDILHRNLCSVGCRDSVSRAACFRTSELLLAPAQVLLPCMRLSTPMFVPCDSYVQGHGLLLGMMPHNTNHAWAKEMGGSSF